MYTVAYRQDVAEALAKLPCQQLVLQLKIVLNNYRNSLSVTEAERLLRHKEMIWALGKFVYEDKWSEELHRQNYQDWQDKGAAYMKQKTMNPWDEKESV